MTELKPSFPPCPHGLAAYRCTDCLHAEILRLRFLRDAAVADLEAHAPGIEEWEQMKAENERLARELEDEKLAHGNCAAEHEDDRQQIERLRDAIEYALPFSGADTREVLERALEPVTNGE